MVMKHKAEYKEGPEASENFEKLAKAVLRTVAGAHRVRKHLFTLLDLEYRYRRKPRGGNMKSKLLLTVSLLLLVPAAFSQDNSNTTGVTIRRDMALQGADPANPALPKGAPVRVYGTASDSSALMSRITVANNSTKSVSSLEYGWRIAAPTACTDSTLPVRWDTATVSFNKFAPGEQLDIDMPKSLSRDGSALDLAKEASASGAHVVLITVGIVEVIFADGSAWTDSEALRTSNFDGDLHEKMNDCHGPIVSEMQHKAS
jgi:hypothetical protein